MAKLPAHLVTIHEVKRCSLCKKEFPVDVKPSLSKAFAAHIRQEHKTTPVATAPKKAS